MTVSSPLSNDATARPRWTVHIGLAVLAAVVAMAPTAVNDFGPGDDVRLLLQHPLVSQPSVGNAVRLFGTLEAQRDLYQPLPLLVYMAEHAMYGRSATGYHVDRIVLHAINAALVWVLIWHLTGHALLATLVAVGFGVHPLAVEAIASVAKVTIPLSTAFILVAMIAWLRWRDGGGQRWYAVVVAATVLTMLCKPIVTLPLGLWLLDVHRGWRFRWRWMARWLPLVVLMAGAALLNWHLTSQAGLTAQAQRELAGPPVARALLVTRWALSATLMPVGLSPWYPPPDVVAWTDPDVVAGSAAMVFVIVLAVAVARANRDIALGLGLFVVFLAPYQASVVARYAMTADRFMYLPLVGLLLAGAAAAVHVARRATAIRRVSPAWRTAALAAAGIVGIAWVAVSWQTGTHYRDALSRSRRVVQRWPAHPHALKSLGRAMASRPGWLRPLVAEDARMAANGYDAQTTWLWYGASQLRPDEPNVQVWQALTLACAGYADEARLRLSRTPIRTEGSTVATLAQLVVQLTDADYVTAAATVEGISGRLWTDDIERAALVRATRAVTALGVARPDEPALLWIGVRLLTMQGQADQARMLRNHLTQRFPASPWAHR